MPKYLKRLKHHPGVPIASFFTVTSFIVGIQSGIVQALLAAGVASLYCWPVVLWTARTQPLPEED